MKTIRIKLTPPALYFLGGERIFEIGSAEQHYFVRSLQTPAQTTLFGILRFLALKKYDALPKRYEPEEIQKHNGKASTSYHLFSPEKQDFGKISSISPLYLVDEADHYYIPTPFDHKAGPYEEDNFLYDPFREYREDALHCKKFPADYTAKHGLAESWVCITPNDCSRYQHTRKKLFGSDVRVIIGRNLDNNREKAYAKKEYAYFREPGFSFAFFAKVADDFPELVNRYVNPGFFAQPEPMKEPEIPADFWRNNPAPLLYAQSDCYLPAKDAQELFDLCNCVLTQAKNFRGRMTNPNQHGVKNIYQRYTETAALLRAGSVFLPKTGCLEQAKALLTAQGQAQTAGFNQIITGGNVK